MTCSLQSVCIYFGFQDNIKIENIDNKVHDLKFKWGSCMQLLRRNNHVEIQVNKI